MVKRPKKRPLTSTSIFDFYDSSGPQTPPVKTIKLMDGRKKVQTLPKDEVVDLLNGMFGAQTCSELY